MTLSKETVRETSSEDIPTSESFDFDLWATKVRRQLVAALNHQVAPELSQNDAQTTPSEL
ncbi:hypothetical protein [Planktothrix paucivesiculata]|jgi:hypothetical protein|uniref:Uncharacterized protein n=1 Tax=Planktothrix paucivesiculata PCC 9631 TaxID=671071 RepID=A0A7Z9DZ52_9CYAN|nr:hypothetical protein [Planktothrix paucivesiculata]OIP67662.1 MAG: hypothetical protein AUK43_18715 [Oscillatoriales cyanobacterium CG2_30_40_61]VXD14600.1 conserved hypothetical protein [Planktothrix paucivesiculata PCC 9631]